MGSRLAYRALIQSNQFFFVIAKIDESTLENEQKNQPEKKFFPHLNLKIEAFTKYFATLRPKLIGIDFFMIHQKNTDMI